MTDPTLDSLRLSWTVPEGHFDSFVVQFKDRDGPRVVPVEGHERSVTVTPLDTGRKYRFLLYGLLGKKRHGPLTAEGTTGESIPAWPGSAPGAPPGWGNTQPGQGSRWSFVLTAISILILLTQPHSTSPVGLSHGKSLSLDLSALPLEVPQATRNSSAAPSVSISESWSGVHDAITKQPPKPRLGEELQVTSVTPDSVSLAWTVPEGQFDSFVVQYKDRDGQPQVVPVEGSLGEVSVSGLDPAHRYKLLLYGLHQGRRVGPISAIALTGE